MRLSKQTINKTIEKQLDELLCQALSELNSKDEVRSVLADLFTEAEYVAILKRLGIAMYLDKGRSYEDIKNNIKVSSATIATVAEKLANAGWQDVIRRIKAEEWADKWTNIISGRIKRFFG